MDIDAFEILGLVDPLWLLRFDHDVFEARAHVLYGVLALQIALVIMGFLFRKIDRVAAARVSFGGFAVVAVGPTILGGAMALTDSRSWAANTVWPDELFRNGDTVVVLSRLRPSPCNISCAQLSIARPDLDIWLLRGIRDVHVGRTLAQVNDTPGLVVQQVVEPPVAGEGGIHGPFPLSRPGVFEVQDLLPEPDLVVAPRAIWPERFRDMGSAFSSVFSVEGHITFIYSGWPEEDAEPVATTIDRCHVIPIPIVWPTSAFGFCNTGHSFAGHLLTD